MRNFLLFLLLVYVIFGCEDHEYKSKRETEQENLNLPPDEGDTVLRDGYYRYTDTFHTQKESYLFVVNLPSEFDSTYIYHQSTCLFDWKELVISNHFYRKPCRKTSFAPCPLEQGDSLNNIRFWFDTTHIDEKINYAFIQQRIKGIKNSLYNEGFDTSIYTFKPIKYNNLYGAQYFYGYKSHYDKTRLKLVTKFYTKDNWIRVEMNFFGIGVLKQKRVFEIIIKSFRFKKN